MALFIISAGIIVVYILVFLQDANAASNDDSSYRYNHLLAAQNAPKTIHLSFFFFLKRPPAVGISA
jgi:hypothetical protein